MSNPVKIAGEVNSLIELAEDFADKEIQPDEFTVYDAMKMYGKKQYTTYTILSHLVESGKLTVRRVAYNGKECNAYKKA